MEVGRRLLEVPGIGPVLASVADPALFKSGRDLAAWMGLCRERTQVAARSAWAASPKPVRLSAEDADGRRHGGDPLRPAQQYTRALARAASGPPPNEGCGYRARQQDARTVWALMTSGEALSRSTGHSCGCVGNGIEKLHGKQSAAAVALTSLGRANGS
jgi:transposase